MPYAPVVGVAAYVLVATVDWEVPAPGGFRFAPLWLGLTALAAATARLVRGRLGPVALLAAAAGAAMVLGDVTLFWSQGLRDLHLYLKAGARFLDGSPVYLDGLLAERPADLSEFPFLYPPLTLPAFAALSALPWVVVDAAWVAGSVAVAVAGLRAIGLPTRWAIAALAWPPFAQGLYVGNVAIPAFGLFAVAPWLGGALVPAAIFKLYNGIAALWLVRDRHLRSLAAGIGAAVAVALATVPLTGVDLWWRWLEGLDWYSRSQPLLPGSLYGFGLPRYVPAWVGAAAGLLAIALALQVRGRSGLGRLGVATVVASPSSYAHGFTLAVPAILELRPLWLWLVLSITSVAPGIAWWVALAVVVAAWRLDALRRASAGTVAAGTPDDDDAWLHPLPAAVEPWPKAPPRPLDDALAPPRPLDEAEAIARARAYEAAVGVPSQSTSQPPASRRRSGRAGLRRASRRPR